MILLLSQGYGTKMLVSEAPTVAIPGRAVVHAAVEVDTGIASAGNKMMKAVASGG